MCENAEQINNLLEEGLNIWYSCNREEYRNCERILERSNQHKIVYFGNTMNIKKDTNRKEFTQARFSIFFNSTRGKRVNGVIFGKHLE